MVWKLRKQLVRKVTMKKRRKRSEDGDDEAYIPSLEHVQDVQTPPSSGGRKKSNARKRVISPAVRKFKIKLKSKPASEPQQPPSEPQQPSAPLHQTPPQQPLPDPIPSPPKQLSPQHVQSPQSLISEEISSNTKGEIRRVLG
ncbi:hypothetical protein Hanom_Chr15g01392121 [Helianthus anomalus]